MTSTDLEATALPTEPQSLPKLVTTLNSVHQDGICKSYSSFFKWTNSVFSNTHYYNFYNKKLWNMSWSSSIRSLDSNSRPLVHESPPITNRPGLPPLIVQFFNRPISSSYSPWFSQTYSRAKHFSIIEIGNQILSWYLECWQDDCY